MATLTIYDKKVMYAICAYYLKKFITISIKFTIKYYMEQKKKAQTFLDKIRYEYLPTIKTIHTEIHVIMMLLVMFGAIASHILEYFILKKFHLITVFIEGVCYLFSKINLKEMLDDFHPDILFNHLVEKKKEKTMIEKILEFIIINYETKKEIILGLSKEIYNELTIRDVLIGMFGIMCKIKDMINKNKINIPKASQFINFMSIIIFIKLIIYEYKIRK